MTKESSFSKAGIHFDRARIFRQRAPAASRRSQFKAWLMNQGAEAITSMPEEFGAFVKSEIAQYVVLVKKSGMKPE